MGDRVDDAHRGGDEPAGVVVAVLAAALGDEDLQLGLSPGNVEPYVVWERKRALEWIHGAQW